MRLTDEEYRDLLISHSDVRSGLYRLSDEEYVNFMKEYGETIC